MDLGDCNGTLGAHVPTLATLATHEHVVAMDTVPGRWLMQAIPSYKYVFDDDCFQPVQVLGPKPAVFEQCHHMHMT